MTKKTTGRKLLTASNALLALAACDDFEARLQTHWEWAEKQDLARWQMDQLPTFDSLLYAAETLSIMASDVDAKSGGGSPLGRIKGPLDEQ